MGAHRYRSTWRGITFNAVYDDSGLVEEEAHLNSAFLESDYRLRYLDPTGVSVQDYREFRQYMEGAEPNEAYEGPRIIEGRGMILGSTPADLEDKTWALYEAFSPAACRVAFANNDPPFVGAFDFKRDTAGGSKSLRWYCRPAIGRPLAVGAMREGLIRPFVFRLMAFDPRAYDQSLTSTVLGNLAGSNNTVTNPGNLHTHPKIVIVTSGASGSKTLTNVTTGESLVIDLTSAGAGQTYTLDTWRTLFTREDGSDQMSKLTSGFPADFFLPAGNNLITWSSASGITSVTFQFRGAYA